MFFQVARQPQAAIEDGRLPAGTRPDNEVDLAVARLPGAALLVRPVADRRSALARSFLESSAPSYFVVIVRRK
jgi:hypothetical protein